MPNRILEQRDGPTAILTIDNPARFNALTLSMWADLKTAFDGLAEEDDLRCVVIQGAGEAAFSAGADISEFETTRSTRDQVTRFHEEFVGACLGAIAACPVAVVAKIRGSCMGGGLEIAAACDIRLADDSARFGAPVGRLGFPLAFGETQGLFQLVGPAVTAELLLEGRILTAAEAYDRRLVTRLSRPDGLDAEVAASVANICASGQGAARTHKRQLRRLIADMSPVSLDERMAGYAFAETEEYQQRFRAFLDKRRGGGKAR